MNRRLLLLVLLAIAPANAGASPLQFTFQGTLGGGGLDQNGQWADLLGLNGATLTILGTLDTLDSPISTIGSDFPSSISSRYALNGLTASLTNRPDGAANASIDYTADLIVVNYFNPDYVRPYTDLVALGSGPAVAALGSSFFMPAIQFMLNQQAQLQGNTAPLPLFERNDLAEIKTAYLRSESARYLVTTSEVSLRPVPVPEPATLLLLGSGLGGIIWARRRKTAN